jgi:leader peptidase (prepilin peptidase)/N-methyltransferase
VTYVYGDEKWFTPIFGMMSGSGILFLVAIIGLLIFKTDNAMGMGDVKLLAPVGCSWGGNYA